MKFKKLTILIASAITLSANAAYFAIIDINDSVHNGGSHVKPDGGDSGKPDEGGNPDEGGDVKPDPSKKLTWGQYLFSKNNESKKCNPVDGDLTNGKSYCCSALGLSPSDANYPDASEDLKVERVNRLRLDRNNLANVDFLKTVKTADELLIDSNPITQLNGLINLTDAESINVSKTKLVDLTGLSKLSSVEKINIEDIPTLTSLKGMDVLTRLNGGQSYLTLSNLPLLNTFKDLNLTTIDGDLVLRGSFGANDLNGFEKLKTIGDDLVISTNSITSLNGLKPTRVKGSVTISNTEKLTDISSLQSITDAQNADILIKSNKDLEHLTPLNIKNMGLVTITDNQKLKTLDFANSPYSEIRGEFRVENNPALENFNGLEKVRSIRGLTIRNNPKLTDLSGLSNITKAYCEPTGSFSGTFVIDNPSIKDFKWLSNLGNCTSSGNKEITIMQMTTKDMFPTKGSAWCTNAMYETLKNNTGPYMDAKAACK